MVVVHAMFILSVYLIRRATASFAEYRIILAQVSLKMPSHPLELLIFVDLGAPLKF